MYDDTDLLDNPAVRFAPSVFWKPKSIGSGPPEGPWHLTYQKTGKAGSILQVYADGNMLTLYQEFATPKNSNDIQVCLVVYGTKANELVCGNFSQKGTGRFLRPIAFYGLGEGMHQLIFENKKPQKQFIVDAIRVTP